MGILSPAEVEQLFAAARAHGVLSFKYGTLQATLDPNQPAHRRSKPVEKPQDMMDLAMGVLRRKASDRGEE